MVEAMLSRIALVFYGDLRRVILTSSVGRQGLDFFVFAFVYRFRYHSLLLLAFVSGIGKLLEVLASLILLQKSINLDNLTQQGC